MWQRGLYPTVTCPETRVVAEWHLCWPPIARAIAEHRCVAYAFGVADDDAFTNHLAAAGCTVFAFDPGADHPADWKPNVKFRHWGLTTGAASQAEERRFEGMYGTTAKGEYISLHELQRRLGHETLQVTVAKVDCEGCEWELFRSVGENGGTLSQFEQVLTELHFTSTLRFTVAKAATVVPAFTRLLASSQLFPFHSAEVRVRSAVAPPLARALHTLHHTSIQPDSQTFSLTRSLPRPLPRRIGAMAATATACRCPGSSSRRG